MCKWSEWGLQANAPSFWRIFKICFFWEISLQNLFLSEWSLLYHVLPFWMGTKADKINRNMTVTSGPFILPVQTWLCVYSYFRFTLLCQNVWTETFNFRLRWETSFLIRKNFYDSGCLRKGKLFQQFRQNRKILLFTITFVIFFFFFVCLKISHVALFRSTAEYIRSTLSLF